MGKYSELRATRQIGTTALYIAWMLQKLCGSDPWAADFQSDQVVGVMYVEAGFMYSALAMLNQCTRKQYNFWQFAFGTDCLHDSLYYFNVVDIRAFEKPVELPLTDHRKLKCFFGQVDLHSLGYIYIYIYIYIHIYTYIYIYGGFSGFSLGYSGFRRLL